MEGGIVVHCHHTQRDRTLGCSGCRLPQLECMSIVILLPHHDVDMAAGQTIDHRPLGVLLGHFGQQLHRCGEVEPPTVLREAVLYLVIAPALPLAGIRNRGNQEIGGQMPRVFIGQEVYVALIELDQDRMTGSVGHEIVQRGAATPLNVVALENGHRFIHRAGVIQDFSNDRDRVDGLHRRVGVHTTRWHGSHAHHQAGLVHAIEGDERRIEQTL